MCAAPARVFFCRASNVRQMFGFCIILLLYKHNLNIYSWAFNSMNEKTTNKIITAIKSASGGCETQSVCASHTECYLIWKRLSTTVTASYIRFISNVNNLRHGNITLMECIFQWNRLINFANRIQMGCVLFIAQAIVIVSNTTYTVCRWRASGDITV